MCEGQTEMRLNLLMEETLDLEYQLREKVAEQELTAMKVVGSI